MFDFKFQAKFVAFCITFCVCGNMDLDSATFDDVDTIFDTSVE